MFIDTLKVSLILSAALAFAGLLQETPGGEKVVPPQSTLAKTKELQKEKVRAAKEDLEVRNRQLDAGFGMPTICFLLDASRRLALAQFEATDKREEQIKALQAHFNTTKDIQQLDQARFDAGRLPIYDLLRTKFYCLEAEIWLEQAKTGKLKHAASANEKVARNQEKVGSDGAKSDFDMKLKKLLQAQVESAKAETEARTGPYEAGTAGPLDFLLGASRRFMAAQMRIYENKSDRLKALESYLARMRKIEEITERWLKQKADFFLVSELDLSESIHWRLEAEILLERCKAGTLKKAAFGEWAADDNEEISVHDQAKNPLDSKLQELLQARAKAAKVEVEGRIKEFEEGKGTLDFLLGASRRFLQAELEATGKKTDQLKALQAHFDRMKKIQDINQERWNQGRISLTDLAEAKYYRFEAEIWLENDKKGATQLDR
jgi:hypothetical protein